MSNIIEQLTRRKVVDFGHSELRRVLGVVDLTMLGVGSTIGVGIYVLAGQVSRDTSGPAVTISFLIAAVASLFAGLCYAEFGARVPKAGSAYIYTYVCIGEFVAFIIGWNLILEYVIGTASVARGFSLYVDALANNSIEDALYDAMPLVPREDYTTSFLSPYPDFLSFGLAVLLSVALALGVKESSRMNNIFTGINIIVIVFVIIGAGMNAHPEYWNISSDEIDSVCNVTEDAKPWGTGGFAPFGFTGIMEGAATCFFGFVGFDIIATTGEEALNPSRTIPISIGVSLTIIFLSYFGVSAVLTLAIPYCLQDEDAPLVVLFDQDHIGWEAAKWFVSIGALFGFSASLFGAMFPLPRVIYAMASDGLMFRSLAKVSKRFQTPTFATAIAGIFAGGMAMFFNLDALVNMMSIGTLMAYTIVALCVLLLRYTMNEEDEDEEEAIPPSSTSGPSVSDYMRQLFNQNNLKKPTSLTGSLVTYATLSFCVLVLILNILLVALHKELAAANVGAIVAVVLMAILNIANLIIIACQPVSKKKLSFKVPLVPWLPAISTFINLYLMCNLKLDTWIRFVIWMAIGFLDYFGYGLWNSVLRKNNSQQGLDNPGYLDEKPKNHQLIIPKIEIQPATPLSSEPNTPVVKPKGPPTPATKSPLASKEIEGSMFSSEDSTKRVTGPDNTKPFDAVAVVASLMSRKINKDAVIPSEEDSTKDMSDKEGVKEVESEMVKGGGDKSEVGEIKDSKDVTDGVLLPTSTTRTYAKPIGFPVEDVKKTGEHTQTEATKETEGAGTKLEEGTEKEIIKKLDEVDGLVKYEKVDSKIEEEKRNEKDDKETEGNKTTKEKHNKPPPLNLNMNLHTNTTEDSGIPRTSYSSPELSPPHSPPPSPPPSSPASPPPRPSPSTAHPARPKPLIRSQSEAALNHHSVPTTPVGKRHPVKVLRRMSSFDDIPPSSPDSPFARRVASFVVIPVHEPGLESTENSIPPSPSTEASYSQDLIQAVDKLNRYRDEDRKIFTMGSADSLDSLPSDASEPSEFLGLRRGVSREPDMLDPIRERGESKLYTNEPDKTEIRPS